VKPAKIIAGQDAEKTNEFLQRLGTAILDKVLYVHLWVWVD